ncbi:hypothetical protein GCM10022215_16400 [Nocardioides fonticola]|uniref:Uncharacterized protein n=1 Tax=Nocardioides fonticola TaxID=450363 RepID=A0ABP7XHR0_9ACTN
MLLKVLPILLSAGSLAVAITALVLTYRRSGQALEHSRKAAASALWSGVQTAVQRFIGFDPSVEPLGDRLANFRIATIALVDELDGWKGLDTWLDAERNLGALLGRQVMEAAQDGDSVDQRLANLDPYQQWAQALGSNLRRFRAVGFDADAAAKLQAAAERNIENLYAKHGWEKPQVVQRIRPLA